MDAEAQFFHYTHMELYFLHWNQIGIVLLSYHFLGRSGRYSPQ